MNFRIVSESTCDFSEQMLAKISELEILPMEIIVDGRPYQYHAADPSKSDISLKKFYEFLRSGLYSSTSQINPIIYYEQFEKILSRGEDLLYICFSSGLSSTYQTAKGVLDELAVKYPDRRITIIDSLCACSGQAILVSEAAVLQQEGKSFDEIVRWVEESKMKMNHWFVADSFRHLKNGGRVSAPVAAIGATLNIKPIIFVDGEGHTTVSNVPRGKKRAQNMLLDYFEEFWDPSFSKKVLVGHSDELGNADMVKELVLSRFPEAEIEYFEVGPIIGSHTGPGISGLIYWGKARYEKD